MCADILTYIALAIANFACICALIVTIIAPGEANKPKDPDSNKAQEKK